MALAYLMINFTTLVSLRDAESGDVIPSSERLNLIVEYLAIGVIAFIVVVNFSIMVRLSFKKITTSCKKKKMAKQHAAQMEKQ